MNIITLHGKVVKDAESILVNVAASKTSSDKSPPIDGLFKRLDSTHYQR